MQLYPWAAPPIRHPTWRHCLNVWWGLKSISRKLHYFNLIQLRLFRSTLSTSAHWPLLLHHDSGSENTVDCKGDEEKVSCKYLWQFGCCMEMASWNINEYTGIGIVCTMFSMFLRKLGACYRIIVFYYLDAFRAWCWERANELGRCTEWRSGTNCLAWMTKMWFRSDMAMFIFFYGVNAFYFWKYFIMSFTSDIPVKEYWKYGS